MIRWALLSLLALGVLGFAGKLVFDDRGGAMRIPYDDPLTVDRGRDLYMANCASCHGQNLEGQANWKSRLPNGRLPAPPHDETGHTWHHPDGQLFEVTKYGTAQFAPPGYQTDMRGYEDILTDQDIMTVLAFIKASWPEKVQDRHSAMSESTR